jgi:hypothetical protein
VCVAIVVVGMGAGRALNEWHSRIQEGMLSTV